MGRIPSVEVKFVDIRRNTGGEGLSDAKARKRGEQTGLDTPVVHAVNDEYQLFEKSTFQVAQLTR